MHVVKLLVLLNEDDPSSWDRATDAERQAVMDHHAAFAAALRHRGSILGGEALAAATEARGVKGGLVVDGPYAESAEHLGGYYLVDVDSMETALEIACLLPPHYSVEIRPVVEIEESGG